MFCNIVFHNFLCSMAIMVHINPNQRFKTSMILLYFILQTQLFIDFRKYICIKYILNEYNYSN